MVDTKRKRMVYKVALFLKDHGDSAVNLEALLKRAIKKKRLAEHRMFTPQADDGEHQFINYSGDQRGRSDSDVKSQIFGCEFLAFEKGSDQSTLKLLEGKEELDLDAIDAGDGKEFLAGSVYFGVCKNHVVVMGSRSLDAKHLESYLNWFLIQQAKVLSDDNGVLLSDHLPEAKKKSVSFKGVKCIDMSAPITMKLHEDQPKATRQFKEQGESYNVKMAGAAWDAVKAFIADAFDLPTSINVEDLADTPNIEVSLSLKWKGRHDEDGVDLLDKVAKGMRHVNDEMDYSIKTNTGSITREDFKHFGFVSTPWQKGRPQFDDLFPKMAEWLASLMRNGIVDP